MHERNGKPPKDQGGWVFLTADLLNSPAWLSLSVNAYRVISCLMSEHLRQGRKANGDLTVPHRQFRKAGACADLIADAIDELIFKGLLRVNRGRAADGTPHPSKYRLTWLVDHEATAPTNDWKGCTEERCSEWLKVRKDRKQVRAERAGRKKKARSDFSEFRRSDFSELGPSAKVAS